MSRKRDIRRIEAVAAEFGMDPEEQREFGDDIEDRKRNGERGAGQDGDFSKAELRERVTEFRGET